MELKELLTITTALGYDILRHGAETYRVEECITRMCRAYGYPQAEVFVIPSSIVVTITAPDGEYLIKALVRMKISMDKYKTSEMGRALKKVYHGKMSVEESVSLAEREISEVFHRPSEPPETDKDTGFFGDIVGKCPLCGKDVIRYKNGYSCSGYKEGCEFSVYGFLCRRVISKSNMQMLLETGRSSKIKGFISKNGKSFDAYLKLEEGKVVFDFGKE